MNLERAQGISAAVPDAPGSLSAARFWALFVALFVIAALPMLRAELPPFADYPNHLARMHVLIEQPHSEALQRNYEIHWRLLPNLAMDLAVPLLARVMPLEWAGKVFILVCLGLLAGGVSLVHRAATGRWSVWPLFAFTVLYSRPLVWGYLNYVCALGLALMAFALWLALARRGGTTRLAAASACALVLFFAHLMGCAVFAVLLAGHQIGELWPERPVSARKIVGRAVTVGVPFLVPLAILMADGLGGRLGDIRYDGLLRKLLMLQIYEGHLELDIAGSLALAALAAVYYGKRYVTFVPALLAPLLLLVLAYLLAPVQLMTAEGVDDRLPLAILLVVAAGTISHHLSAAPMRIAALAGLALFVARTGITAVDCERANQIYPRLIALLDQVPLGGRLAVAYGPNMFGPNGIPITHLPTLAVVRRDALVTTLFASETQQPVTVTPAASALLTDAAAPRELWAALISGDARSGSVRSVLAGFDALVVLDGRPFAAPSAPFLVPIGIEPDFALYRNSR